MPFTCWITHRRPSPTSCVISRVPTARGRRHRRLEGIKEAYETGRGAFKTREGPDRARDRLDGHHRHAAASTWSAPKKVIEKIKENANAGRLKGFLGPNLTDRIHGLRLVIEVKNGFNRGRASAALPAHAAGDSFSINAVALWAASRARWGSRRCCRSS